jgi:hypothetical protein
VQRVQKWLNIHEDDHSGCSRASRLDLILENWAVEAACWRTPILQQSGSGNGCSLTVVNARAFLFPVLQDF